MTTSFCSQLPSSASKIERLLEQVFFEELALIERDVSSFFDPYQCRLDLLPYLAWELSVDHWKDDWSEEVKRDVCANAILVHSCKGTRGAVENALEALKVTARLTEWYEAEPALPAGRFNVTAWANENLSPGHNSFLSPELAQEVRTAIDNSKNARSHYTLSLGANFSLPKLAFGTLPITSQGLLKVACEQQPELKHHQINMGLGSRLINQGTLKASFQKEELATNLTTQLSLGLTVTNVGVFRITMESN